MAPSIAAPHKGDVPTCPTNGQKTRPVGRATVENLVRPEFASELVPQPYYFCNGPECDVVYVSALGEHLITKDMLKVRVGIKEEEDPVTICYCFGYERKDIEDDIRRKGRTDIQNIIAGRVRAGECRCEITNPSGGCCLGEVAKAIRTAVSNIAGGEAKA